MGIVYGYKDAKKPKIRITHVKSSLGQPFESLERGLERGKKWPKNTEFDGKSKKRDHFLSIIPPYYINKVFLFFLFKPPFMVFWTHVIYQKYIISFKNQLVQKSMKQGPNQKNKITLFT